jgi:signal transduction histidine kinase
MPENLQQTLLGRYQHLIDVQQELAAVMNTDQLIEQTVRAAIELCQAEYAIIFMPDPTNQILLYKTGTLPNQAKLRQLAVKIEDSLEGWVFFRQQPVIINNPATYDQHFGKITVIDHVEIHSITSIPLIAKGTSIGVLDVFNQRKGSFNALDQEILSSFAKQVAIFMVNTQRFVQSDLVAELVHELRTPLVSLNMAMHLLQRKDLPGVKRERIFELITTEFNRLSDMTTSFLEYARLESGRTKFNPIRFNLNALLSESAEVMQFQAEAREVTITLQVSEEPLYLIGDRDKIKQVVLNLLNNAIKYNHPGGSVLISAQQTLTDVTISVRDDGQGIAEEHMPRLFTRFFRAPNRENVTIGTGLGLSICKQIVEAHHGKLEVTSELDRGSTFTVRLPVVKEDEFIPLE